MNFVKLVCSKGLVALLVAAVLGACSNEAPAKSPQEVSVSAATFNYADQSVVNVLVNGKWAGSADRPKQGEVSASGFVCCVRLDRRATTAAVEVRLADGTSFKVDAKVMKPWPEVASYAVVHLLPGRRALIEVVPTTPLNEIERLPALLKALEQ